MIDPTGALTSLIATVPGTNRIASSPLDHSGFGPDAIVELGKKTFGGVPGYALATKLGTVLTGTLQSKLSAPTQRVPIFSQKQAQQLGKIITKAAQALNNGDFQQAKAHTQELLQRDVNDPTAYHLLGRIAQAEGDQKTAIEHLQRASELAPQSERIAGDLFVARQLLRSDTDPTRGSFKSSLANELNEFGLKLMNVNNDYERALEMLGRARALYPENATYKSNYEAALNLKIQNPTS